MVDDDNVDDWDDDDDIAQCAGYSHAKTMSDNVGAVPNHVPDYCGSDRMNDLEHSSHGQNVYCMARGADGYKESGDANMIYASRNNGAAHYPMS